MKYSKKIGTKFSAFFKKALITEQLVFSVTLSLVVSLLSIFDIITLAPDFMVSGDVKDKSLYNDKWILFRNDGNFKFIDVAEEAKIAGYEFSWGCTFADMNNDGLPDLMVAENYVDFLKTHPS